MVPRDASRGRPGYCRYPVNAVAMEVLRLSKKGMVDISRPTTRPPVAIDSLGAARWGEQPAR